MKKLFATFLAILYISVSSGATLHFQYCMGQFVKVTLWHDNKKKCEACGMAKSNKSHKNCCKDKHQHLQIEKDQKHSRYTAPACYFLVSKTAGTQYHTPDFLAYVITKFSIGQAPPIAGNTPVFIRNCNFRI
jgi:ABC-type ATPase with predicted acetyltransferase domain